MSEIEDPTPATPETPAGADARDDLAMPADLAAESFGDYARTAVARVRAGESGVLPVVGGLILVSILFQSMNSNFLTAGNLVNLLVQSAFVSLLAMAEVFVLLLGEIDLSVGYVGAIAAAITASAVGPHHQWNWIPAIAAGLLACAGIGLLQGSLITRLGLPSFVVTLAGLLFWNGVLLKILGNGGTVPINNSVINDIAAANLSPTVGWIVMLVVVALYGAMTWRRDDKRRRSGLVAPPTSVTFAKIGAALIFGIAIVLLCNTNRGVLLPIRGVPYVVLLVVAVLAVWSFLLGRTKFGRYVYAIGGNAEAARRAGINVAGVRTLAFVLCSFTAGIAGIVYESRLQSISTAYDGGTYVLYAVAAAVIGGTSLFGGHGKAIHAVLGGIVIGAIDNGMGLVGFTAASQYMVTALVLLVAVIIDAVARRGRVASV
jgi:D-xylose transport system permease protein